MMSVNVLLEYYYRLVTAMLLQIRVKENHLFINLMEHVQAHVVMDFIPTTMFAMNVE